MSPLHARSLCLEKIQEVFDFVAAEGVLPEVLTGFGLVPGVVSTSDVTGPWDTPGSSRTVHLAGGSTAHEEVKEYGRPSYFAYRVSDPTFSLRYLMAHARGQWWFDSVEGARTCGGSIPSARREC